MNPNEVAPQGMTTPVESSARRVSLTGDWVITIVLLVVMVAAFIASMDWPRDAAFFPRLLSGTGAVLSVLHLVVLARAARVRRDGEAAADAPVSPPADLPAGPDAENAIDGDADRQILIADSDSDEEGDEDELSGVFSTATRKQWLGLVGWFTLFFGGLYLIGFLAILVVFTIAYLVVVQKSKWWHIALYVLCTAGAMYLLFVVFLHLPLPEGVLTAGLGF
jgi:hypothetical protein